MDRAILYLLVHHQDCCLTWMHLAAYRWHRKHSFTSELLPYRQHRLKIRAQIFYYCKFALFQDRKITIPTTYSEKFWINLLKKIITSFANSCRDFMFRLPPRPRNKLIINCARSVHPWRWDSPFITVPTKLVSTTESFCKLQVAVNLNIFLRINMIYC